MKLLSVITMFLIFLLTEDLAAGGFDYNTTFGTRTMSLNGLYFAGSPGLGTVYSNPAGLAHLNRFGIEITVVNKIEKNQFENSVRGLYKSYSNDNYGAGGGIYWKLNDRFTIGAVYHPLIDYRVDWPFAVLRGTNVMAFSMMNRFEINSITPTIAYRSGSFSIGLTGNIYKAVNQLNFPRQNMDTIGFADYQFQYDIDAWAYGGTIGILYDFNETLTIGLSIKSGFKIDFKGEAKSRMFADISATAPTTAINSKFEIPWKFGLGFLYTLGDHTLLNIDILYSLWNSTGKNREFRFEDQIWQSGTVSIDSLSGISASLVPLNFNNTFDIGIGFEYDSGNRMIYRAGYRFSQSPAPESAYGFLFPTGDQNILTAGFGYKDGNLVLDAAISYFFGFEKTIEASENRYLFGKYFISGYMPSITLRYEL